MPISILMKLSQSMAELYNVMAKLKGPVEARGLIEAIVHNAISDIQDSGMPITSNNLEKEIMKSLNDFLDVAKKTNVA